MDHEDDVFVVSLTGEFMSRSDLRRLTRHACRTNDDLAWDLLVEQIDCGAPVFPVVDELLSACAELVKHHPVALDDPITREITLMANGRGSAMHLTLLQSRTDQEIRSLVISLIELYVKISQTDTTIVVG